MAGAVVARDQLELEAEWVDHGECGGIGGPANMNREAGVPALLRNRDSVVHDERDAIVRHGWTRHDELSSDAEAEHNTVIAECRVTHLPAAQRIAVEGAGSGERGPGCSDRAGHSD